MEYDHEKRSVTLCFVLVILPHALSVAAEQDVQENLRQGKRELYEGHMKKANYGLQWPVILRYPDPDRGILKTGMVLLKKPASMVRQSDFR